MVAMSTISTWVAAPPVAPRPYGLFTVAPPENPADPHWMTGIQWYSNACTDVFTTVDACISGTTPPAKTQHAAGYCGAYLSAEPFTVYALESRSGVSPDVAAAEVRAGFEAAEQAGVESWLWTYLNNLTLTPGTANDPVGGLAVIESMLGALYNGTGVIHLGPLAATLVSQHLVRSGTQLQTVLGTPVVVGAGYDNPAKTIDTGTVTMFGTGQVVIRRSTLDVHQGVALSVNDFQVLVERTYVVGIDCAVVEATVTL